MAEISANNILTSANRHRLNADAERARRQEQQDKNAVADRQFAEALKRKDVAAEIARRNELALQEQRRQIKAEIAQSLNVKRQQRDLETTDDATRALRVRDDVITALAADRTDEAAIRAIAERRAENAAAVVAEETLRGTSAAAPPDLRTFLSQRDQRVSLRQQQERDFQVQQRIDLRVADDNINSANPNAIRGNDQYARGSIVDVSG